MTLAEPLAWSPAPLQLPADLLLTPEQFEQVCAANPEAVLELSADGLLITMTPTGSETGARNSRLVMRLLLWADRVGGWKVFDSSTGFRLPDGSIVSPDAAVISQRRWLSLSADERRGFAPLCPDLVVELASPSDDGPRSVAALRSKMQRYQANGARLGWLLLPEEQAVELWPAHGDPQRIEQATSVSAGDACPELILDLTEIWAG